MCLLSPLPQGWVCPLPAPVSPVPGVLPDTSREEYRDQGCPKISSLDDYVLGLLGCGPSPFCPALTDVLISQAGRPWPLGMNFWSPMGRSFSGTKRGKYWAVSAVAPMARGTSLGALVVLGSNLGQQGWVLNVESLPTPGVRVPNPSGRWDGVAGFCLQWPCQRN